MAAGPRGVLVLPFAFTLMLVAFGLMPSARGSMSLQLSIWGTAAVLFVWTGLLLEAAIRRGRTLGLRVIIRRPHYLQPLVQGSIYVYWGWHWRQVYGSADLIVAQLVFAYAFDMLLAWSRRDTYELGFGPFPIILSTNLFMWFKPDWFYLQFVMVAIGFAAKEFLRWKKDGYFTHIFNPSSFPLAIISIGLLLTGTTDHTWGKEIAVTLEHPRHMYEMIFLVSIPGQILFGVASMTMPAVTTAFLLSLVYQGVTGTYFFFGPVPIAAFLGMLLLFTDPSTAPKTELGRILYGVLYGTSVFVLYGILDLTGQPTFYDKLLAVPLLNLGVRAIDRWARSPALSRFSPEQLGKSLRPRARNVVYMTLWIVAFGCIDLAHGVGDLHPGNRRPFWERACREGRRNACRNLTTMDLEFCNHGAGWACNELAILSMGNPTSLGARLPALEGFRRACDLGFQTGCDNAKLQVNPVAVAALPRHAPPAPGDYQIMLESKAVPRDASVLDLWESACEQGWSEGCLNLGDLFMWSGLVPRDVARGLQGFQRACDLDSGKGCAALGSLYKAGPGVSHDEARARTYTGKACKLGIKPACDELGRAETK